MDHPAAAEIQVEGKRPEKGQVFRELVRGDLGERCRMLAPVLPVSRPEPAVRLSWIPGVEAEGVPLVVAEHCKSGFRLEHRTNEAQGLADLRAAIEEVGDKDRHTVRVAVRASIQAVAQPKQ